MTSNQIGRLKLILEGANTDYCIRAQGYDKEIFNKYRQELLDKIWPAILNKFIDEKKVKEVKTLLETLIKDCLNDFDENFATRLIENYTLIISEHNQSYRQTLTTDFYMSLQQVT
jgi:hypothetical protein